MPALADRLIGPQGGVVAATAAGAIVGGFLGVPGLIIGGGLGLALGLYNEWPNLKGEHVE